MKNKKLILLICIYVSCIASFFSLTYAYNGNTKKASPNIKKIISYKQLQASVKEINKEANSQKLEGSLALEDKKVEKVENLVKNIEKFLNTKASTTLGENQLDNLQISVLKTIQQKIHGNEINIRIVSFGYNGILFGKFNSWFYIQWWDKNFVSSKLIRGRCTPDGIIDFFAAKLKDKVGVITKSFDIESPPKPRSMFISSYVINNNILLQKTLFDLKSIKRNKYWRYSNKKNEIIFSPKKDRIDFNINNKNEFNIQCENKVWKFKFVNDLLTCYSN